MPVKTTADVNYQVGPIGGRLTVAAKPVKTLSRKTHCQRNLSPAAFSALYNGLLADKLQAMRMPLDQFSRWC
jgi:hypothetical protein